MLIYIVRHGLTEWNKLKKLQGAADVPLAKEGILLAEKTGEALKDVKFDICFTSPLSRARQTAECVLGDRNVPIIPDKRIQEINFGDLEGGCVRDAEGNYIDPQVEMFFRDPVNFKRPENGEDIFDDDRRLFLHAAPKASDYELHVPFIIWTSSGYGKQYPGILKTLSGHRTQQVQTSLSAFHTMLGIGGILTRYRQDKYSVASEKYHPVKLFYLDDHDKAIPQETAKY